MSGRPDFFSYELFTWTIRAIVIITLEERLLSGALASGSCTRLIRLKELIDTTIPGSDNIPQTYSEDYVNQHIY